MSDLSEDEMVLQEDFMKDKGYIARQAIRLYVENDEPIPNELKQILYRILEMDYAGKGPKETEAFWRNLIIQVAFLIRETGASVLDAIGIIAEENNINDTTLLGNYKKKKYRWLKDAILKGVQKK